MRKYVEMFSKKWETSQKSLFVRMIRSGKLESVCWLMMQWWFNPQQDMNNGDFGQAELDSINRVQQHVKDGTKLVSSIRKREIQREMWRLADRNDDRIFFDPEVSDADRSDIVTRLIELFGL